MVRAVHPGYNRSDRWPFVALGADPGGRATVAGLHHHVRFVIALATVHRTDCRDLIHDPGLLGQVFTDLDSRQGCLGNTKGSPVFIGTIRLRIPCIQMARATRQPEQDDALACPHGTAAYRCLGPLLEQPGQGEPRQASETSLEHAPAVKHCQAFTLPSMKARESMLAMLEYRTTRHRYTLRELPCPLLYYPEYRFVHPSSMTIVSSRSGGSRQSPAARRGITLEAG